MTWKVIVLASGHEISRRDTIADNMYEYEIWCPEAYSRTWEFHGPKLDKVKCKCGFECDIDAYLALDAVLEAGVED